MKRLQSATKRNQLPVDVDRRELRRLQVENTELRRTLTDKEKEASRLPPAEKRVLVEFGVPDSIVKPTDPFLWSKLVQENITLKNKLTQLEHSYDQLRERCIKEKESRPNTKIVSPNAAHVQLIAELTSKIEELEKKLAIHRKNESDLKMRLLESQQYQQEANTFVDDANYKYGKVGAMEKQIVQLREKKQFYRRQQNDAMLIAFRQKFPIYHESVFQTLRIYKQLERFISMEPNRRADIALNTMVKFVVKVAGSAKEAVTNWIRYRFYKKESYHPSNLEMVETMLEKWRTSNQSQLLNEVRFRQKQATELMWEMQRTQELLHEKEQTIFQLRANNEVILQRNRQLEQMLKHNAYDFGYTLYHKLKRYEEDRRDLLTAGEHKQQEHSSGQTQPLSLLVEPEYVHLKELINTLKDSTNFNRQPQLLQQRNLESAKRRIVEEHLEDHKYEYSRPKRTVTILKKNVYGYWEDPSFSSKQYRKRLTYKRLIDKYTQTNYETEELERRFCRATVYNGALRLTNLKIDPYLKLCYGLIEAKTTVKSGREPFWNESFLFEEASPFLSLKLYDKNKIGHDTYLGTASIDLKDVFESKEEKEIRIEARLEDEEKGFTGRVWIGLTMLEKQRVIHIEEIQGCLNKDFDLLSDMDPYLEFKFDGRLTDSAPVLRNAGKNPIWRQHFDLLPLWSNTNLEVFMFDEDVVKDDEIGQAKQVISDISEGLQSIQLDLTNKDEHVGIIRFKVSCREYTNSRIRKREPYLQAIDEEERIYFEIGQAKMKVEKSKLGAGYGYLAAYGEEKHTSKLSKGNELFWPEYSVFRARRTVTAIELNILEKPLLGDSRILCQPKLDISSQLDNNFEGKESLKIETGQGLFEISMNIFKEVKVLFFGMMRIEFTRKSIRHDVSIRIAGCEPTKLEAKGPDYETSDETMKEAILDSAKQEVRFEVLEGRQIVASCSISIKKFMANFISEITVELKSKGQKTGELFMRAGLKTFSNQAIKPRPKERVKLEMAYREYYRLLVHKAILTRDTELIGEMDAYCQLEYGSRKYTTPTKKGKNPIWDSKFLLYRSMKDRLAYRLMDQQGVGSDDLIGEGQLDLERCFNSKTQDLIGQVYYEQAGVGNLFLSLQPIGVQYVIKITTIRAQLYEDSDWIGKIDPYVEFNIEGKLVCQTTVLDECGQNPSWNIELEIEVENSQHFQLQTLFKDKDVIGSDYLGTATFSISQLSEYVTEVEALLMKQNQQLGRVYLTAAFIKFTNDREMAKVEKERPESLGQLDLKWLHIGELSSTKDELREAQIRYRYPFEHHTSSLSGSVVYFGSQQIVNVQPDNLRMELHLNNLLGVSSPRAYFEVSEEMLRDIPHEFSIFDIPSLPIGKQSRLNQYKLKLGVSNAENVVVFYFQDVALRDVSNSIGMSILFRSEIEQKAIVPAAHDKFWLYTVSGDLFLTVTHHQLLSEKEIGRIKLSADILSDEYLEWRDFEVFNGKQRTAVISARCCKIKYSWPFLNRCRQASPKAQCIMGARIKNVVFDPTVNPAARQQFTGTVVTKSFNQMFELSEGTTIWCPSDSEVKILQGNREIGQLLCRKELTDQVAFLQNSKRVAALKYDVVKMNKSHVFVSFITLRYMRIQLGEDKMKMLPNIEFTLLYKTKQYTTRTVIGRNCCFENCQFGLEEDDVAITLTFEIRDQSRKALLSESISVQFKKQCYFEGKIPELIGSYAVEHCSGQQQQTTEVIKEKNELDFEQDIFSIHSLGVSLSESSGLTGDHYCSVAYAGTEAHTTSVQITNVLTSFEGKMHFLLEDTVEPVLVLVIKDRRDEVRASARLSFEATTKCKSHQTIKLSAQVYAGKQAIGTLFASFQYVTNLVYRAVKLRKIDFADDFDGKSVTWNLKSGSTVVQTGDARVQLNAVVPKKSRISIFTPLDEPLQLEVASKGRIIGRTVLSEQVQIQPLCLEQLTGVVDYSLRKVEHVKKYAEKSSPKLSAEGQQTQLSTFSITTLFLAKESNETVYIRAEVDGKILESQQIKPEGHIYQNNFFDLTLQGNLKLYVLRRQHSGDEIIGSCKINCRAFQKTAEKLYNKGEIAGVVTFTLKPVEQGRSYCKISKLAAHSLKNTELLASMTPYVKITSGGMIYRTTTLLGRSNLSWDIELLLPSPIKVLFEVMDRDMMFDDDVGKVEVEVANAIHRQDNKFNLNIKGKQQGIIEASIDSFVSTKMKMPQGVVLNEGACQGIKFSSLKLADKNYRGELFLKVGTGTRHQTFSAYHRDKGQVLFDGEFLFIGQQPITVQFFTQNGKTASSEVLLSQIEISPHQLQTSNTFRLMSLNNNKASFGELEIAYSDYTCELLRIDNVELILSETGNQSRFVCCFPSNSRFSRYKSVMQGGNQLTSFPDQFYLETQSDLEFRFYQDEEELGKVTVPKNTLNLSQQHRIITDGKKTIGYVLFNNTLQKFEGKSKLQERPLVQKSLKKWVRLNIVRAELTRDVELLGKMDPYCSFMADGKQHKTPVQQDKGKNPQWNAEFIFEFTDKLEIRVMDSEVLKDRQVGKCNIELMDTDKEMIAQLQYKGQIAGKLFLKLSIIKEYVRFSQIQPVYLKLEAALITVDQTGYQISNSTGNMLRYTALSVPVADEMITIRVEGEHPLTVAVKDIRNKPRGWLDSPSKTFTLSYQLFS